MKKLINIIFLDKLLTYIIKVLMFIALIVAILFFSFTAQGCSNPNQPDNGWDTIYPHSAEASYLIVPSSDVSFAAAFNAYLTANNCLAESSCLDEDNPEKSAYKVGINGKCLNHTNECVNAYNDLYWIAESNLPEICTGVGTCKAEIKSKYIGQL